MLGRLLCGLCVVYGLAGCAGLEDRPPHPVAEALIGKTQHELLSCAGAPLAESRHQGFTILTYYKEASLLEESFPLSKTTLPKVHHGCRARIRLEDDRVTGVEYHPVPQDFHEEVHCDEIFLPCLTGS